MAKKENSGLKAGFTKDEAVVRKADVKREAEDKAALEQAKQEAAEAQKAQDAADAARAEVENAQGTALAA